MYIDIHKIIVRFISPRKISMSQLKGDINELPLCILLFGMNIG